MALADGGSVSFWNEEDRGMIFAQSRAADGTPRGESIIVSPRTMHVVGAPRAATVDGHHVVVAFIACGEGGFELVAAAFDGTR